MNKALWLIAAILIFVGPIAGVYLGIHPLILPFLGIACGLAAIVRGAKALPHDLGDGPASAGAQADAKILCNKTLDSPRRIVILDGRSLGPPPL